MTTTYLSGYDLDYRPATYWPDDPTIKIMTAVKGEERRRFIRLCVEAGDDSVLDDPMAATALSEDERDAAGAIHPSFMGGEYLPDLLPREIEIARISLASTTSDVISIRARLAHTRIHYRIVDEYDTDYDVSPRTSRQPLSLHQMINLLREGSSNSLPERLRQVPLEGGMAPEEIVDFASVSSEFYPELGLYYAEEASLWLQEYWHEEEQGAWTPDHEAAFQRRLLAGPWESPWVFPDYTVDDLDPVDARMLGLWLQARTGDPDAAVIIDCPARQGEGVCAIEIRWSDPELNRVRIADEQMSVVSAFSRFLVAAYGEPYPFPREDASPHADNPYPPRSPQAFAEATVDDLDSVEAQQLGKWLRKHTGDAQATVILKAPPRDGETACAIEIRWHDPEPNHLRIAAGEGVSVVAAFSRFLEADQPRNQRPCGSPSGIYPNYNVRVYNPDAEHRQWCEDRDIPLALFINYDGGGYRCRCNSHPPKAAPDTWTTGLFAQRQWFGARIDKGPAMAKKSSRGYPLHRSWSALAERLQRELQLNFPDDLPGPMVVYVVDRSPGGDSPVARGGIQHDQAARISRRDFCRAISPAMEG